MFNSTERNALRAVERRLAELADRLAPAEERTVGARAISKADASTELWDLRDAVKSLVEATEG